LCWYAGAGLASADTLSVEAYRARLREARALVASARTAPGPARAPLLNRAGALLRSTTAVRLGDATTIAIDDGVLADRLGSTDGALERALGDLDRLSAFADSAAAPGVDGATADARLRALVGEQQTRSAQATLFTIVRAIADRLVELMGRPDPRILVPAQVAVGLALAFVLVATLVRGVRERIRAEVVLPERRAARGADPAVQLRRAEEALAAGRGREAIHALYLYALGALAEREALAYDPALTDRELLSRAAAVPHVDALRDLVVLHERVWFGLRDASAAEPARARALALRVAP